MKKITFKSQNVDGKVIEYQYNSVEELEKEWLSDSIDMNVPANDDPIWDVMIDGKPDLREATYDKIESGDYVYFEDLLTYVGIEIW